MIRLDGVSKTYRTRRGDLVHAVLDITLSVGNNEFVTLVGPSGCGKSTLLKLVAGLVTGSSGSIRVRDQLVRDPFPDVILSATSYWKTDLAFSALLLLSLMAILLFGAVSLAERLLCPWLAPETDG
ncbi:MAG TPA: ATP-binding cassette domain-containing protein [Candidatus Methylomirabilis sp.]|nr:ATP-binding cassette domain-containing protein [Candidatus Methylomirabilis sp.]